MTKSPIDFDTSEFFARLDAEEYVQLEKQYAGQKKAAQNRVNDKLFQALKAQIERKRVILPKDLEVDSIHGDDVDESIFDEIIEDEERKTQMGEVDEISQKLDQSTASAASLNTADSRPASSINWDCTFSQQPPNLPMCCKLGKT